MIHDNRIFYKAFSRKEEALNGSDCEWGILTDEFSSDKEYRFPVQAKKLKPHNMDNYPLVAYSNKNDFQIDLLIQEAKAKRAMPLYAYYSSCCTADKKYRLCSQNVAEMV